MPCPKKVQKKYKKGKIETDKRRKHFFHTFLYLLGEWTNQRYVPRHSVVPKTPDSKIGVVGLTSLPEKRGRFTENLSIYLSSPAPNSLLENPSNFGATASHWLLYILLFFLFSDFNRMDAWSFMRGDAFIHFVSGSRRVNIRLGVLLLIPKSPQTKWSYIKQKQQQPKGHNSIIPWCTLISNHHVLQFITHLSWNCQLWFYSFLLLF